MPKVYVSLSDNAGLGHVPVPWSYNEIGDSPGVGVKKADLIDDTNSVTGWQLEVTTTFTSAFGNVGTATTGAGDWTDDEPFDYHWYVTTIAGQLQISGLTSGHDYTLEVAGHRSNNNSARPTEYIVDSTAKDYLESGTSTPTAPTIFTGTVPGNGILTIDVYEGSTSSQGIGYIDGFTLETVGASFTVDTVTDPTVDQVESEITTTGLTGTASATLGGKALTLGGSFAAEPLTFTIDIAALASETTGPDIGSVQTLVVTGDEGSPTTTLTTAVKSGWSVTTLAGTLNTGDGGMIKAMNDALTEASLPTKTIVVGDRMYFDAADSSAVAVDSTYTGDSNNFAILLGQGGSSTTVTTWTPFIVTFSVGGGFSIRSMISNSIRASIRNSNG
jgi:hypothetical protein